MHWRLFLFLSVFIISSCQPPHDHSHGPTEPADEEIEPVVLTLFAERSWLFMEYPQLVVGEPARFLAHLTRTVDGEPISSGSVRIEAVSKSGERVSAKVDAPKRDALYIPELTFTKPGEYAATLRLESPLASDTFELPTFVVHADTAGARAAAEADAGPEPADAVPFLLEQQWKIKSTLAVASELPLKERFIAVASVRLPPLAESVVTAPVSGRFIATPDAPKFGEVVAVGRAMGRIEVPPRDQTALQADRAQIEALALEAALRNFDLDTRRLDVEQSLARASVQREFGERAVERLRGLRPKGLATEDEVQKAEEAKLLAVADETNAKKSLTALDDAAKRLEQLRSSMSRRLEGTAEGAFTADLVAPIAGTVIGIERVPGEHVEAGSVLYRIAALDPVWIEARIPEFDFQRLGDTPAARVGAPALVGAEQAATWSDVRWVGASHAVDPESQTILLRYEASNADRRFVVGRTLDAEIETRRVENAVAIPRESVVMDNGRPVVFVLLGGETFQKRYVELGIRDGEHVQISSGVSVGERVAAKGAAAIRLASVAPAQFGHGHAH